MGTKGFVAFTANGVVDDDTVVLGVNCDGFLNNLTSLAQEALEEAKKARVLTRFRKGERGVVKQLLKRVCDNNFGWCSVDIHKNTVWIDYSVIVNLKTGKVTMWEGNVEFPYTAPESVLQQTARVTA